ncbi:phosphoesterase [Clostridium tetani]|nr:phosphoesterase [Clostridium tetani]RXI63563.1 phosphoesterase [Clostridium tetani]RXI66397.1 phosphoesterase [Clostridium tetani]RXI72428.1 phosphoesterase [Clostridium tetani]RXM55576.1 phosphoesterase [Clostridium tetani]
MDSDEKASWDFDVKPHNFNYNELKKNANKIIKNRNGRYSFLKGSIYKIKVKLLQKMR